MQAWYKCRNEGWILPTVYQGHYNALHRELESDVIPVLRMLGMRLHCCEWCTCTLTAVALSATSRLLPIDSTVTHTRMDTADSPLEAGLLGETVPGLAERSAKKISDRLQSAGAGMVEALSAIDAACARHGVPKQLASMRWLFHHSALWPGDAVISGGATLQQVRGRAFAVDTPSIPAVYP